MAEENQNKGVLDNLSSRSAFKAGMIIGIVGMLVIGLGIALGLVLKDKNKNGDNLAFNNTNTTVNGQNNNGQNGANATEIKIEPISKSDWVKGDSNAQISIIEFSDADCPYCQRYHDTTNQLLKDYNGKIKLAYRHFPLPSLHPEAPKKAEAIECVGELGGNDKVWAFLDKLFVATNKPTLAQLGEVVKGLGIDQDKFQKCLDSGKYTAKVSTQATAAQAAGAQGTPYSVILSGNQKIPINGAYPIEEIKSVLDSLLK
ncbi:MAG: thioredoxin domain-containing protein [Patescibacteria group bacterium]